MALPAAELWQRFLKFLPTLLETVQLVHSFCSQGVFLGNCRIKTPGPSTKSPHVTQTRFLSTTGLCPDCLEFFPITAQLDVYLVSYLDSVFAWKVGRCPFFPVMY